MFLQKIAPYLTIFQDLDFVIISDYLKRIANIVAKHFFHSIYSYYNKYFYKNRKTNYTKIVAKKFWGIAYAKNKLVLDKILKKIRK